MEADLLVHFLIETRYMLMSYGFFKSRQKKTKDGNVEDLEDVLKPQGYSGQNYIEINK